MSPGQWHTFGWVKSQDDSRDLRYALPAPSPSAAAALPTAWVPDGSLPPCPDQGQGQSCVGFATARGMLKAQQNQGLSRPFPSPLFIWHGTRAMEGTAGENVGVQPRDAFKFLNRVGAVPDGAWPYDLSKLGLEPPPEVYAQAQGDQALSFHMVEKGIDPIRQAMVSGDLVLFGIDVYESMEGEATAASGVVPMPRAGEGMLGRHYICGEGYDHERHRLLFANSWGVKWGMAGYGWLPYDYLPMVGDIYVIRLVTP